jgi:glycoside/pentoside/hexuronide:cation symporter, GPH family
MAEQARDLDYGSDTPAVEVDHVPLREKIGLGLGKAVVDGTQGSLQVLLSQVYVMTMGLAPALLSTIVFIQRMWDAMIDPVFGQFSDNFRTPWGRRLPLIFAGAIPLGLLFAALWWFPATASSNYLFYFLLIVSLAFYTAHSLFAMPLGGLIVEATDDYHERTKIAGVTLAFGFAVQIGSQWIFPLTVLPIFGGIVNGTRWVTAGCALIFIAAGIAPVFLCRERLYKKQVVAQQKVGFFTGLKAASSNRSFLILLLARGIFSLSYNIVGFLGDFMYYYWVWDGDMGRGAFYKAIIGSSYHVFALVTSLAVFPYIERAFGKRVTMQISASAMILGCIGKIFFYQPGYIWLPMFVTITNGVANAGVALMATAMLGDIADQDEINTGLRREGLFSSLLSWFEKAGNSVGTLFTGLILGWIHYIGPKKPGDIVHQSHHTLILMKINYILYPGIGAVLTILAIWRYKLTREQADANKDELARRRSVANAVTPEA